MLILLKKISLLAAAAPLWIGEAKLMDLHRGSISGDHMYSLSKDELVNAGYAYEGVTCRVFDVAPLPRNTSRTVYRFNGACVDHMLAFARETGGAQPPCGGYVLEDMTFFTLANGSTAVSEGAALPLYRLYSASAVDHLYTTSAGERDVLLASGDWLEEETTGFCLPTIADDGGPDGDGDCPVVGYAGSDCERCASDNPAAPYPFCDLAPAPPVPPLVPLPQALQGHDDQSYVARVGTENCSGTSAIFPQRCMYLYAFAPRLKVNRTRQVRGHHHRPRCPGPPVTLVAFNAPMS